MSNVMIKLTKGRAAGLYVTRISDSHISYGVEAKALVLLPKVLKYFNTLSDYRITRDGPVAVSTDRERNKGYAHLDDIKE